MHHCSSHEPERYFSVGFSPCPTPGITSAVWHQTARPHTVHSMFLHYVLQAEQFTNYCMMQYGRVSMCRTSTLLDHPFQYHRYSPSWLVLMKTAWLAGRCPLPPFLLYVVRRSFNLSMYSSLSEIFFFFFNWKSTLILCWVILCYNYYTLQVLSQLIMNMQTLLYPERAFSCMMPAMLVLMICTSCYITFTHCM